MLVHPEDPKNLGEIKQFEIKHGKKHNLVTLDLEEIAQEYKKINQETAEIAMCIWMMNRMFKQIA